MPGIVRLSDLCSGHCFEPRSSLMASFNVIANEERCTRAGDNRRFHRCDGECHNGVNCGVHDVFINNMSAQAKDDPVSCGSTQVMGSENVFVN